MSRRLVLLFLTICCAGTLQAADGAAVYAAFGLKTADVLTGTTLTAPVQKGAGSQVVGLVTYFTGKKNKADAVNVELGVFSEQGSKLVPIFRRDLGEIHGGFVANADLQLFDLDADGLQEIIVTFDSFKDPLIEQRVCEIIVQNHGAFEVAWTGAVEYDATRAARDVPDERRDHYTRELDFGATRRTRGVTLFVNKKVLAVAGSTLAQPKVVQETFPLRKASGW